MAEVENGLMLTVRQASALISRAVIAARAGITFGGKRDLYDSFGYKRELTIQDFRDRYKRDGIAQRVVDSYPNATWRVPVELIDDETIEKQTEFEKAWEELESRLGLVPTYRQADILAGIGRYSVLFYGVNDGKDASEPLDLGRKFKPEDLLYVMALDEEGAQIATYDTDTKTVHYGWPNEYNVRIGTMEARAQNRKVHWTRTQHIVEAATNDSVFSEPRLMKVWNRFDDLEKVVGGGAEAFWLRAHQGRVYNIDKDMQIGPDEMAKVRAEVDEMTHGMRRDLRARGINVQQLGSDVADFTNQVMTIVGLISGSCGIPQRLLLGSERGELASAQDRDNWNDRVQERRDSFAFPRILKPSAQWMIDRGFLPEPKEKKFEVRWPTAIGLSDSDRAQVAKSLAEVNQSAGETVITANEIRDRVLGLPPLTEEDLAPQREREEKEEAERQEQLDALRGRNEPNGDERE